MPSPAAGGQDYFSLDDILSSQQRVPCRVEQPLYRLGFLNTNSSEEHLLPGTKLELPLWLARNLCSRRRHIVSVQLPKAYRESQRTILSADACVVDLHRLGPYYYSVGVQLLGLASDEELELSRSLLEVRECRGGDSRVMTCTLPPLPLTPSLDVPESVPANHGHISECIPAGQYSSDQHDG